MYTPTDIHPMIVGMIYTISIYTATDIHTAPGPEGPIDTQQLKHIPQLLAEYIQYQCIHQLTYIARLLA